MELKVRKETEETEELLTRRHWKEIDTIEKLLATGDTANVKHLVGAIRDARKSWMIG